MHAHARKHTQTYLHTHTHRGCPKKMYTHLNSENEPHYKCLCLSAESQVVST